MEIKTPKYQIKIRLWSLALLLKIIWIFSAGYKELPSTIPVREEMM